MLRTSVAKAFLAIAAVIVFAAATEACCKNKGGSGCGMNQGCGQMNQGCGQMNYGCGQMNHGGCCLMNLCGRNNNNCCGQMQGGCQPVYAPAQVMPVPAGGTTPPPAVKKLETVVTPSTSGIILLQTTGVYVH